MKTNPKTEEKNRGREVKKSFKKQKNNSFLSSRAKGYQKEEKVCQFLTQRGWQIVSKNKKILGVEVDILVKKKKELIVIEVKSISHPSQVERILKPKQKERLQKVAESLCTKPHYYIRLFLATIDNKNQIDFFEIC